MKRELARHSLEICAKCGGRQIGDVDFKTSRVEVIFPSACKTKDACEEAIHKALCVTLKRDVEGKIIR